MRFRGNEERQAGLRRIEASRRGEADGESPACRNAERRQGAGVVREEGSIEDRFPETRWTWIEAAGGGGIQRERALENLLSAYQPALERHLRTWHRMTEADARDCLQDFIIDKVIGRNLMARVDRARGRFRGFLCRSLARFVANRRRRDRAARRAPDRADAGVDAVELKDPNTGPDGAIEELFHRLFFEEVILRALDRMRAQCAASDRDALWAVFESRVLGRTFEGRPPVPYARLVPLLGLENGAEAANLLVTAKRMFVRCLRATVREYAADDAELAGELVELRRRLGEPADQGS